MEAEPQTDEPQEEAPSEAESRSGESSDAESEPETSGLTLTPTEASEPAGDRSAPEAAESEETQARDYVLNTNTGKFHYPDCRSVGDMAEKNRQDVHDTREHILDMGYVPCKICNP